MGLMPPLVPTLGLIPIARSDAPLVPAHSGSELIPTQVPTLGLIPTVGMMLTQKDPLFGSDLVPFLGLMPTIVLMSTLRMQS